MNRFEQQSLAWKLAEVADPYLSDDERPWLWVKIGAGELDSALFALAGRCLRHDAAMPADVAALLRDWLHGYAGTDVPGALKGYLDGIPARDAIAGADGRPNGVCTACGRLDGRPRRNPVGADSEWHRTVLAGHNNVVGDSQRER